MKLDRESAEVLAVMRERSVYRDRLAEVLEGLPAVWEQLNGVLYDLTEGDPQDAVEAVEDCIARLTAIMEKGETA